jgi:hypothetical protein
MLAKEVKYYNFLLFSYNGYYRESIVAGRGKRECSSPGICSTDFPAQLNTVSTYPLCPLPPFILLSKPLRPFVLCVLRGEIFLYAKLLPNTLILAKRHHFGTKLTGVKHLYYIQEQPGTILSVILEPECAIADFIYDII